MSMHDEIDQDRGDLSSSQGRLVSDFHEGNEHPAMSIPFTAVVDGRSYEGISISLVEARVSGLAAFGLAQGVRMASFRFDFGQFLFSLPVAVTFAAVNNDTGEITLAFSEPAGPHMPQLRYILNAWLAGDVINLHDMLQARARLPKASSRSERYSRPGVVHRVLARTTGLLATTAATALFVFAASALLSDRLFLHELQGPAFAVWDGPVLRATTSGQLSFLAEAAEKGEPLYTIITSTGSAVTAVMPCNCEVKQQLTGSADTVLMGEPIVSLAAPSAGLVVEARFSAEDLKALRDDARLTVTTADGASQAATYLRILPHANDADPATAVTVLMNSEPPLAVSNAGKPITVTIDTTPSWLSFLAAARASVIAHLSNLFGALAHDNDI